MYWNKIATYAVDSIALASAMIIATPFALVISAPVLGAFSTLTLPLEPSPPGRSLSLPPGGLFCPPFREDQAEKYDRRSGTPVGPDEAGRSNIAIGESGGLQVAAA